jgi:hypothetical protein
MRFYQTLGIVAAIALLASLTGPASAGHERSNSGASSAGHEMSTSMDHGPRRSPAFVNNGPAPRHSSRHFATNANPFAGCHYYLICPPNEGTDCKNAHVAIQCPRK